MVHCLSKNPMDTSVVPQNDEELAKMLQEEYVRLGSLADQHTPVGDGVLFLPVPLDLDLPCGHKVNSSEALEALNCGSNPTCWLCRHPFNPRIVPGFNQAKHDDAVKKRKREQYTDTMMQVVEQYLHEEDAALEHAGAEDEYTQRQIIGDAQFAERLQQQENAAGALAEQEADGVVADRQEGRAGDIRIAAAGVFTTVAVAVGAALKRLRS